MIIRNVVDERERVIMKEWTRSMIQRARVKCPKGEHIDAGWGKAVLRKLMKGHAELLTYH